MKVARSSSKEAYSASAMPLTTREPKNGGGGTGTSVAPSERGPARRSCSAPSAALPSAPLRAEKRGGGPRPVVAHIRTGARRRVLLGLLGGLALGRDARRPLPAGLALGGLAALALGELGVTRPVRVDSPPAPPDRHQGV